MSTTSQTSDSLYSRESFSNDFTEVNSWIASLKVSFSFMKSFDIIRHVFVRNAYSHRSVVFYPFIICFFKHVQRSVRESTFFFFPFAVVFLLFFTMYFTVNSPSKMNCERKQRRDNRLILYFFLSLIFSSRSEEGISFGKEKETFYHLTNHLRVWQNN